MKQQRVRLWMMVAGMVTTQVLLPSVAHASTSFTYKPTTIVVAGNPIFLPKHIVATDPWSGQPTSWVPIYYLQQALRMEGAFTTWNGNTLNVLSIPSGWGVNVNGTEQTSNPPIGQMQFLVNGTQSGLICAPKLVANAPYTTIPTTYVPVYYANLFLRNQLHMGVSWDNSTWKMASRQDVNTIVMTASPSTANVGQSVTVSGEYRLVGGLGGPDIQLNVTGLPNTNNQTIVTNASGLFTFSTAFRTAGEYTITVGNAAVSRQVVVTVE